MGYTSNQLINIFIKVSSTALITNYPKKHSQTDLISKHFEYLIMSFSLYLTTVVFYPYDQANLFFLLPKREAYPDLQLADVQFAYNISKLESLEKDRRSMYIGKVTSERILAETTKRPQMIPIHFGSCCTCFTDEIGDESAGGLTDSITYYTEREAELSAKIDELREETLENPLGILFVTFESQKMTETFLTCYRLGPFGNFLNLASILNQIRCCACKELAHTSSVSDELRSNHWHAEDAPSPSNIKWENLAKIGFVWWLRYILINLVLIILMVFFTTPAILMDKLSQWSQIFSFNKFEVNINCVTITRDKKCEKLTFLF
jgi:hypothetical protein